MTQLECSYECAHYYMENSVYHNIMALKNWIVSPSKWTIFQEENTLFYMTLSMTLRMCTRQCYQTCGHTIL